jgi:hypothetical protein
VAAIEGVSAEAVAGVLVNAAGVAGADGVLA